MANYPFQSCKEIFRKEVGSRKSTYLDLYISKTFSNENDVYGHNSERAGGYPIEQGRKAASLAQSFKSRY